MMDGDIAVVSNDDVIKREVMDSKMPMEFRSTTICSLRECETKLAKNLCIIDVPNKFVTSGQYDIGGTYTNCVPDLWFYMTISICPGKNILLNLFVLNRNVGTISVGISESNILRSEIVQTLGAVVPKDLIWKTFKSLKCDENHHIKTYVFNKNDELLKKNTMAIPIRIEFQSHSPLNFNIAEKVKSKHNIINLFKKSQPDFNLISDSEKKYATHKIILCIQSRPWKDMIEKSDTDFIRLDINDDEMEFLMEFMYSGNLKQTIHYDNVQIIELAKKFEMLKLLALIENTVMKQITVENALDIAKISQKYDLKNLEKAVFQYVRVNPLVLETESWKNLNDIVLTKKMLENIYFEKRYFT